ncbi:MAG: 30S ribosomal protein S8e [Candidatus Woesearchaeota archaeon]|jgi:small subunit ribosomal protein S8e|nr:30S ribosomal protein S8e [Candidatus Woesearchaeota archaeon]
MASSQFRSKKQVSGKRYIPVRKKRAQDMVGIPALTSIDRLRLKLKRVAGGNQKKSLLSTDKVCVSDLGKTQTLKILDVENNPANINFTRRNLITKGAIVKTEKGNVKITSRPGQSGSLFGVLIK